MAYKCEKCNHEFNTKGNYLRHINKKLSCVPEEKDNQLQKEKTCFDCMKTFSNKRNLTLHIESGKCKKQSLNNEVNQNVEMLLKKQEEHEEQIKKMEATIKELQKNELPIVNVNKFDNVVINNAPLQRNK